MSLLKNGFTDSPPVLLRQFLNIDLNDPAIIDEDCALLRHRLDALESR